MSGRRGDWMQTFTGVQFWPLDPRPEDVRIEDIAHALAHLCRYAGHCQTFYSVAQHSVLVSHLVPEGCALWGLLHDASEAYVVDIPRPLKRFIQGYEEIEAAVMRSIAERFGLPGEIPAVVKRVDTQILADEKEQVMGPAPADWRLPYPSTGVRIDPWAPETAKAVFLMRFEELTQAPHQDESEGIALAPGVAEAIGRHLAEVRSSRFIAWK